MKVLGLLGLIDEGECDWKVLVMNVEDPIAPQINGAQLVALCKVNVFLNGPWMVWGTSDINDVERVLPGTVEEIREWYRVYKVAEGKAANSYAFEGTAMNKARGSCAVSEC